MLSEFVLPTGVILQSLSNDELEAYFLLSAKPAMQVWYASVVRAIGAIITERIPQIRVHIETARTNVAGSLEAQ